jgi:hypothetical protein
MSKGEYIRMALRSAPGDTRLFDAALIFWHSEVPLEDAKRYLQVLSRKLK